MQTNTSELYKETYQKLFDLLCQHTNGFDTLNDFQKKALLFHTVLIKNNNIPLIILNKEDIISNQAQFFYHIPSLITSLKLTNDKDKIEIQCIDYEEGKTKVKIAHDNIALKNIDYKNLNETIKGLENYILDNILPSVPQNNSQNNYSQFNSNSYKQHENTSFNFNNIFKNNLNSGTNFPFEGKVGQTYENWEMKSNPYFNSNGMKGGDLVGFNSDFFKNPYGGSGNFMGGYKDPFVGGLSPNLGTGVNNPYGIKYDPVGPFGNIGGPDDPDSQMFPNHPDFNHKKFTKFDKKNPFDI